MNCVSKVNKNAEFYKDSSRFIQHVCQKHEGRGLVNFSHDITYGMGKITMLTKDPLLVEVYEKKQIPMLCTNEFGRVLSDGVYVNKILEQQNPDCSTLMPLLIKIGRQYHLNYGKNSLHLVERENDCQHLYSLFFDLDEQEFLHWVINNGQFLPDFIADYKAGISDIVSAAKADEYKLVLPDFYSTNAELPKNISFTVIHHELNTPIHLTMQQSRCLLLLLKGLSAKQIAIEMQLSYRTIQDYIEHLRYILNCDTSKQLISTYAKQITLLEKQMGK